MSDISSGPAPVVLTNVPNYVADTPELHGFDGWSFDPSLAVSPGTATVTSGVLYLVAVAIWQSTEIFGNVALRVGTAGATLTAGQNLIGVYAITGTSLTLVAASADQSTVWTSTGNKFAQVTPSITGGTTQTTPGLLYIGLLSVGTTPPIFNTGPQTAGSSVQNIGQPTFPKAATSGSALTALPATVATPFAAAQIVLPWVALG